jgi:glycosyltransferase involved in cell wall biosynthesis
MGQALHVAINGLSLPNRSGTGRVVEGLLDGLSRIEVSGIHWDVFLSRGAEIKPDWARANHLEFHCVGPVGTAYRVAWEQIVLPRWVRHRGYQVLHSPAFVAPVYGLGDTLSVVTVHDLAFLRFPETVRWERRVYYHWAILSSTRTAELILTDSESIRDELLTTGTPGEQVKVLPLGVGDRFFSVSDEAIRRVRQRFNLPDHYLLTVGTVEPRKNLDTLLTVFHRTKDIPPFVIAGRLGWGCGFLRDALHDKQTRSRVCYLNHVPEEDLPGLYAGADAFLAPSRYEGFGLTVLEAMAAGCRVIASDIPAHREIGGDCVRYVKPTDSDDWTAAITGALCNMDRHLAVERARAFSWVRHADEYARILKSM